MKSAIVYLKIKPVVPDHFLHRRCHISKLAWRSIDSMDDTQTVMVIPLLTSVVPFRDAEPFPFPYDHVSLASFEFISQA